MKLTRQNFRNIEPIIALLKIQKSLSLSLIHCPCFIFKPVPSVTHVAWVKSVVVVNAAFVVVVSVVVAVSDENAVFL